MKRFLQGFVYAGEGIRYVIRTQRNARVHLGIAIVIGSAGVYFHLMPLEWAIVVLTFGVVFSAEMVNTVAETAVDILTQRHHPMAKVAKDVGAGAVLVAALAALGVGIAIFGPRLWALFFGH
ncbi:MAG TPA: diacylglycerol kinase family protein [Anaerolineae bacterium]